MSAIARANGIDRVFSLTGTRVGKSCLAPRMTVTGAATVTTVLVGGSYVVVFGDYVGDHPNASCGPDTSTLSSASSTVFVGRSRVGRVGDEYSFDNIIVSGFPTVFVGG